MIGEDIRARGAIDRMVGRIMADPAPGVTAAVARDFVVGVAKRNDEDRPLNDLSADKRLRKSQAASVVRATLEAATVRHPRVQRAIRRFGRAVAREYPGLGRAEVETFATARVMEAFLQTPPMVDLGTRLYEAVILAKVSQADALRAARELLAALPMDDAINGAPAKPTITVDVDTIEFRPTQGPPAS